MSSGGTAAAAATEAPKDKAPKDKARAEEPQEKKKGTETPPGKAANANHGDGVSSLGGVAGDSSSDPLLEDPGSDPMAIAIAGGSKLGDPPRGEAKIIPENIVMVNGQELYIPTEHDVLLGRGKPFQCHAGNIRFHDLVDTLRPRYVHAKRYDKLAISTQIIKTIKYGGEFRGRFLQRVEGTEKWEEVPDQVAREKASHALRGKPRKEEYRNSAVRNIKNGNTPGVITMKPDPSRPQQTPPPQLQQQQSQHPYLNALAMDRPTMGQMGGLSGNMGIGAQIAGDDARKRIAAGPNETLLGDGSNGAKRQRLGGVSNGMDERNPSAMGPSSSGMNPNGMGMNHPGLGPGGMNPGPGGMHYPPNMNNFQLQQQRQQQHLQQQQQQGLHSQMSFPGGPRPPMQHNHFGNMPGSGSMSGGVSGGMPGGPNALQHQPSMMSSDMLQQLGSVPQSGLMSASTPLLAASAARNGLYPPQQNAQSPSVGGLAALSEASSSAQPLLTEALMRRNDMDRTTAHMLARQHLLESMLQRERAEQILRDVGGGHPGYPKF